MTIDEILALLSKPRIDQRCATDQQLQEDILNGYNAILNKPFQPHAVARTRHLAYQYCVVMKYLDNLIAWGDHLFQQDTVESINEATQLYVLAANLLGARPAAHPAARDGHSRRPSRNSRSTGSDRSATRWWTWRASSHSISPPPNCRDW